MAGAGPFGWLAVVLALASAVVSVGLGGVALSGRRIPISAFLLLPFCVVAVGAVGSAIAASNALGELVASTPAAQFRIDALARSAAAAEPDVVSRWAAAVAFVIAAWGSGLGSTISAREDYKWTIEQSVLAGVTGLIATFVTLGLSVWWGVGLSGVAFAVVVLLATAGVAAGSVRRTFFEDAPRVACLRFGAAVAAILAIGYAGSAMSVAADASVSQIAGANEGVGALTVAIERYVSTSKLAWAGFGLGGASAILGFLPELGDIVSWPTALDLAASGVVWVVVGLARLFQLDQAGDLEAIGTALPALHAAVEAGGDIPATTIQLRNEVRWARPPVTRFGDVVMWVVKPENKATSTAAWSGWVLLASWDGSRWVDEEIPWKDAPKHDDTLFIAESGLPSAILVDAIGQLPSKRASVLVRSGEIVPTPPPRIAVLNLGQVFFALSPPEKRDIAGNEPKMAWAATLAGPVFKGPVAWFGKNERETRATDLQSAVGETGGLLVSVADGGRVDDLVATCVAGVWRETSAQTTCVVTKDPPDTLRSEASMGFVAPKVRSVELSGKYPASLPGADAAWAREAAAIEYAATHADQAPKGKVAVQFDVTPDGRAINLSTDKENSTVDPPGFVSYVARRVEDADWPRPTDKKTVTGAEVFVTFAAPPAK